MILVQFQITIRYVSSNARPCASSPLWDIGGLRWITHGTTKTGTTEHTIIDQYETKAMNKPWIIYENI